MLIVLSALTVAAVVFGLVAFTLGRDPGLSDPQPDSSARALPADRSIASDDIEKVRFDVAIRGYRMDQVDAFVTGSAAAVRRLEQQVRDLQRKNDKLRRVRDSDTA